MSEFNCEACFKTSLKNNLSTIMLAQPYNQPYNESMLPSFNEGVIFMKHGHKATTLVKLYIYTKLSQAL